MLFLSSYTNKIDRKGRVSVPSSFRDSLIMETFNGIIAYTSFVNPCVEACGMERMEILSETIDNLDPYSETRDAFATTILGGCVQLSLDCDGRIILPKSLIEAAGLKDQACFVGKGTTFEIWSPENFKDYATNLSEIAKKERHNLQFSSRRGGI